MSQLQPDYVAQIDLLARELGIPRTHLSRLPLQPQASAAELVSIGNNPEGQPCRLLRPAARSWHGMYAAARRLEIELVPLSGFRSVDRQAEIIRGKLAVGNPIDDILRSVVAPGFSEHHTGCAIDVGSSEAPPLEEAFANTRAFAWLTLHAGEFGFLLSYPRNNDLGLDYEPWHWRWHADAP